MHHDFLVHVMSWVSTTHDTDSINNDTTAFLRNDQNNIQHDFLGNVTQLALALTSSDAIGIFNSTTAFLQSRNMIFLIRLHHWH